MKDLDIKILMFMLHLKEEKNKIFSNSECKVNIVYIFDDKEELKKYFIDNGFDNVDDELLKLCTFKKSKSGKIISLKKLCDNTIKKYRFSKKPRELSEEEIKAIHDRGHITAYEKVAEWIKNDLCAPGDAIGSAANRCREFSDCYECLVNYASFKDEYESIENYFKVVNSFSHRDNEKAKELVKKD